MSVLFVFVFVPVALALVVAAVIVFVWAAKRGQFDDLETPAIRMVHDDEGDSRVGEQDPRHNARRGSDARGALQRRGRIPNP